jgi:ATP-dependent RNA/DNA helicase IGHMBP2
MPTNLPVPELDRLLDLLRLERDEDYRNYQQYVVQSPLYERRARGYCWYPLRIHASEIGTGERLYLTLERQAQADGPSVFQVGAAVSFFAQADGKPLGSLPGTIVSLWADRVKVALEAQDLPDWADEGRLGLDLLFDNTTYQEMERALREVAQAERSRLAELREVLLGHQPAFFQDLPAPINLPHLNAGQNEALNKVLAAKDLAIVHGPPGTGKTTTLVAAIGQVLKQERQVLVAAPSNAAVDLLSEKLAQAGVRVLRVGNPARVGEEVLPYTLDGQLARHPRFKDLKKLRKDADNFRDMAYKYKRNFGPAEREQRRLLFAEARQCQQEATALEQFMVGEILDKAQAITATLVGSASRLLGKRRFGTVFIDEAAQALEPGCWLPILRADRVVMAGDHQQLPPTVKSQEAARKGLANTLFEKCIARPQSPRADVMLRRQYRMHADIMGFPNEMFYQGQLEADERVANWLVGEGFPAIEFVDTAGCGFEEQADPESGSLCNVGEADLLVKHLETFLSALPSSVDKGSLSLGIISPYKKQAILLSGLLQNKPLPPDTDIDTVDSFQGQERDVIYISLVRANETGEIGFLKDTRRMNVAMTRARKRLVVLGDSATIASHPFYKSFLAYQDTRASYRSAYEYL